MKVLLAGATGTLGVPLVRALVAGGHEVIGISRTSGKHDMLRALGAEPLVADVMDRKALLNAVDGLKADAVLHQMTALKKIPTRHRDMAATDELRAAGTANLLAAARVLGARRFVTQSFFMGYGYGDWGEKVLSEEDPFAPPGQGAFERHLAAMRSTERQTFTAHGIEGIALRYGSLYGPGGATEPMIEMLRRRRLPVPRDGGGITSLIYVEDAAAATVAALERGHPGEAYNVADDEPVSWGDFFGALAKAFGAPQPLEVPRWLFRLMPYARAMMLGAHRLSNAKAKSELLWTADRAHLPRGDLAARPGAGREWLAWRHGMLVLLPPHGPSKRRSRYASAIGWYRMLETNLVRAREYVIGEMMADPRKAPDGTSAKGNPKQEGARTDPRAVRCYSVVACTRRWPNTC
jgi:nucleoside-diphosphate-sugar epimerase